MGILAGLMALLFACYLTYKVCDRDRVIVNSSLLEPSLSRLSSIQLYRSLDKPVKGIGPVNPDELLVTKSPSNTHVSILVQGAGPAGGGRWARGPRRALARLCLAGGRPAGGRPPDQDSEAVGELRVGLSNTGG